MSLGPQERWHGGGSLRARPHGSAGLQALRLRTQGSRPGRARPAPPRQAAPCLSAGARTTAPGVPRGGEPRADWLRQRQSGSGVRVRVSGRGAGPGGAAGPGKRGWGCADPRGSGQWGRALPGCWGVRVVGVSPGQWGWELPGSVGCGEPGTWGGLGPDFGHGDP